MVSSSANIRTRKTIWIGMTKTENALEIETAIMQVIMIENAHWLDSFDIDPEHPECVLLERVGLNIYPYTTINTFLKSFRQDTGFEGIILLADSIGCNTYYPETKVDY